HQPTPDTSSHSLHDALPILDATYYDTSNAQTAMPTAWYAYDSMNRITFSQGTMVNGQIVLDDFDWNTGTSRSVNIGYDAMGNRRDRKSTRLNSSHLGISYAV